MEYILQEDKMTGLAAYLAIAGAGVSAYSSYQQGQNAAQQAKQQAIWEDYNAQIAKREEDAERKASDFEAVQHTRRSEQLLARQRANIRTVGARRAGALRSMSILDTAQARATRGTAAGLKRAGAIGAGSSILEGGAQAAYYKSQA